MQTGTLITTAIPSSSTVPKTGQRLCYDITAEISCGNAAYPGQDGDYQLGTNAVLAPTPGTSGAYLVPTWTGVRFTDNGDGTVRDNLTDLVWLKDASCSDLAGTDVNGGGHWQTALLAAHNLASGTCGLSDGSSANDWRLPNINELHSLVDLSQSDQALPVGHPFISPASWFYWSSSTYVYNDNYAWRVYMSDGNVDDGAKSGIYYVWPVRGGQ